MTPACTVAVMSSGRMSSTRFIRDRSSVMPPRTASSWPSIDVPTPQGMIGTRCARHSRTVSATSSSDSANTTASGGVTG